MNETLTQIIVVIIMIIFIVIVGYAMITSVF